MPDRNDPKNEGHTREWQDRARVVLDAKRDAQTEADPNQSPAQPVKNEESPADNKREGEEEKDDSFY